MCNSIIIEVVYPFTKRKDESRFAWKIKIHMQQYNYGNCAPLCSRGGRVKVSSRGSRSQVGGGEGEEGGRVASYRSRIEVVRP